MRSEERFQPGSLADWREWLAANHGTDAGVWLVTFKKATGRQAFPPEAAIEEALSFGWIDSLPRALDAERTMLWFSPRKASSGWSGVNKRRVERLIAEGRMQPAGWRAIEVAKANGAWERLDAATQLEVPADLEAALRGYPNAAERFAAFPPSARRGILEWIAQAKRPETRARRVAETARLAEQNLRANQPKPKG